MLTYLNMIISRMTAMIVCIRCILEPARSSRAGLIRSSAWRSTMLSVMACGSAISKHGADWWARGTIISRGAIWTFSAGEGRAWVDPCARWIFHRTDRGSITGGTVTTWRWLRRGSTRGALSSSSRSSSGWRLILRRTSWAFSRIIATMWAVSVVRESWNLSLWLLLCKIVVVCDNTCAEFERTSILMNNLVIIMVFFPLKLI